MSPKPWVIDCDPGVDDAIAPSEVTPRQGSEDQDDPVAIACALGGKLTDPYVSSTQSTGADSRTRPNPPDLITN